MQINQNGIWLYGEHVVNSILSSNSRKIYEIVTTKQKLDSIQSLVKNNKLLHCIKIKEKNEIAKYIKINKNNIATAIRCEPKNRKSQNDIIDLINNNEDENGIFLIMDQLNDVHNIGAIIRSCAAFNVANIIIPKHDFPEETAAMVKSAAGNYEYVNFYQVNNINEVIKTLKSFGYWVAGLAGGSNNKITDINKFNKLALVIGSEGSGIRPLVQKNCDLLLNIPINSKVESLNASNAVAIALYEYSKKYI